MKTYLKPFLLLALIIPAKSFAQWTTLNSPTHLALDHAAFPNDATGFVANSNNMKLFRTMDGGITWDSIAFSNYVLDIDFISADTGFVLIGSGGTSYELKTTYNKGNSWSTKPISTSGAYLQTVYFTSATIGYVVDFNAAVQKTTDGGTTWNLAAMASYGFVNDKEHIDQDTLLFTGWDGTFNYKGATFHSYDAGATWQENIYDSTYSTFTGTHFLNGMHGYAVYTSWTGSNAVMAKTSDGGITWNIQTTSATGSFQDIFMVHPTRGYIADAGTSPGILITTDGATFAMDYVTPNVVRKLYSNGNAIWGIGDGGIIVKNATGNGIDELKIERINVYPNPTTGDVYFNFGKPVQVTLFDVNGNEVLSQKINTSEKLNLGNLSNGLYMAKICVDGRIGNAKIMLSR